VWTYRTPQTGFLNWYWYQIGKYLTQLNPEPKMLCRVRNGQRSTSIYSPMSYSHNASDKYLSTIKPKTQNAVLPALRATQHFGFNCNHLLIV